VKLLNLSNQSNHLDQGQAINFAQRTPLEGCV